jgi:hypothetical protein
MIKLLFEACIVASSFLIVVVVFKNILPNLNEYMLLGIIVAALHVLFELTGKQRCPEKEKK